MTKKKEIILKAGRKTKYKPEMCEAILHLFKEGLTQIEVATALGITYETYLVWKKSIPEFSEAINIGLQLSQCWWLKVAREGLKNPKFSYYGWSKQISNMFRYFVDEQPVHLPALKSAATFTDKINVITHAVSDAQITPGEAKRLCEAIAIGAKVEEVTELKKVVEELEAEKKSIKGG